jgi:hypothetical protein
MVEPLPSGYRATLAAAKCTIQVRRDRAMLAASGSPIARPARRVVMPAASSLTHGLTHHEAGPHRVPNSSALALTAGNGTATARRRPL